MKNIFKLTHNSAAKPIALFIIFILLVAFAASLIGCGSDNPVNNGGNNPPPANNDSLVFSLDSMSLYGSGIVTRDSVFSNIFNTGDSIKITFAGETNCGNSDTAYINVSSGNINVAVSNFELPASFVYYGKYAVFSSHAFLYLKSTTIKYIRVKNLKFYKVNPV